MTEQDAINESQRIADAERVRTFLADEAIKRALAALNRAYFDEFKASKTPTEREGAWAKARVVEDFGIQLQAILDVGAVAKHQRNLRDVRRKKRSSDNVDNPLEKRLRGR